MMGLSPPILGEDVVLDMGVFNSLALALIALEAGLELSLESLKRFKKTFGSIILFKIPLAWIMVGGLFVLLASTVLPTVLTIKVWPEINSPGACPVWIVVTPKLRIQSISSSCAL